MKKQKKQKVRNHVAQHSWSKSGAGAHKDKTKYNRKSQDPKVSWLYFFAGWFQAWNSTRYNCFMGV